MAVAVVDANILIDYKDTSDDAQHERATQIVLGFDNGDLPTGRVTNYILTEVLNWIHERHRHDIAVDLQQRLTASAGFDLVHTPQKDFQRARAIFETQDGLSFGDATIAAYMEREDIEYLYSFDDDFDELDHITRLNTAENPFV
jgi:predicted nucleic acid-binding protein